MRCRIRVIGSVIQLGYPGAKAAISSSVGKHSPAPPPTEQGPMQRPPSFMEFIAPPRLLLLKQLSGKRSRIITAG